MSRGIRQNTIPVSTRHDQEIQTDVNLITQAIVSGHSNQLINSSNFFEFSNSKNILQPFSDYYLLSQFNGLLDRLRQQTANMDQFKSRQLINQLSKHVHGLLTRQLRLCGQKSDYYQLLGEKQKQIIALQIKNSHKDANFAKSVKDSELRVIELEREIAHLRHALEGYQSAEEENILYRRYFKEISEIARESRNVSDLDHLLNNEIIPKIRQCQVSLEELAKNLSKDRSNKVKGAIARYARQLNELATSSNLTWEKLDNSAAGFFTSIEHMKGDDWVNKRLNLAERYQQLENRHIACLSLIQQSVRDLQISHPSLNGLADFEKLLRQQSDHGFKTMIVNGWVGLGTVHCHRHSSSSDSDSLQKQLLQFRSIIKSFQKQTKKILQKYPQLHTQFQAEMLSFLEAEIVGELIEGQSLGHIIQIMKHCTQVVNVDNVYNYYSKSDKDLIFNLRILIKALLDKFQSLRQNDGINIEFDEGILALLRNNILDGIDVDDILSLYRPPARVCQVDRIIYRPEFINGQNQRGVPLRAQQGVPLHNKIHEGVILQKGVPICEQINKFICAQKVVGVPHRSQIPCIDTQTINNPLYETIIREQIVQLTKQQCIITKQFEKVIQPFRQEVLATCSQVCDRNIPYQVIKKQIQQVEVNTPQVIKDKVEYAKVIKVPTTVPVYYEKPIYQIVEKPCPYIVKREEPVYIPHEKVIIQTTEVPVCVDRIVEKRVDVIDHCDCQKPEVVNLKTQVPVKIEVPKQIFVEKAHFVKGDTIQKCVDVTVVKQVPLIQQFIKQVEFCVQRLFVQEIWDEKLVVYEKQKPIQFIRYKPVELHVEKPVIIKDQVVKQILVEVPVPIIIEKEVCKIVECKFETIVEKIVQVPRVEIIEKIVQKIVPVPRIVQKICLVPQIIEKCVVLNRPILELVEIQKQIPVIQKQHQIVHVDCVREILRIEKEPEYIEVKPDPIQTKKIIKEPEVIELVRQKVVQCIREVERNIQCQVVVPLVHKMVETCPIEVVRQQSYCVERQVPIVSEVPIFYKQPQFVIQDCELKVQKIVECKKQVIDVVYVDKPYCLYEDRPVQIPSEPIILKQKELQLVYIDKEPIVEQIVKCVSQPHYLYADKVVKVCEESFVQPEKVVQYLKQPKQIKVQRLVEGVHCIENPIEYPTVRFSEMRTIIQTPEVCRQERIVACKQKQIIPGDIQVVEIEVPCERRVQYGVDVVQKILVKDTVPECVYIEKQKIIEGLKQVIYKSTTCPEYIEKIVEKIIMIPQVVEVQKKIFMIEEVNKLIAKQINLQVYKEQYSVQVEKLKNKTDILIQRIKNTRGKIDTDILADLQIFNRILKSVDGMPKIVSIPEEVKVEVEKDRPVLVPVFDYEQEITLQTIIGKLVDGISKFRKEDIEKHFEQQIINMFFYDYSKSRSTDIMQKTKQYIMENRQEYDKLRDEHQQNNKHIFDFISSNWQSWIKDYDGQLPQTQPYKHISQAFTRYRKGYNSKHDDYAALKATFIKHHMEHHTKMEQTQNLNIFYIQIIQKLWHQIEDLKKKLATEAFNRDQISCEYASVLRSLKSSINDKQGDQIISSTIQNVLNNPSSLMNGENYSHYSSRIVRTVITESEEIVRHNQSQEAMLQKQKSLSEMIQQISKYEQQVFEDQRKLSQFERQNNDLKKDIAQLKQFSTTTETNAYEIRNEIKNEWQQKIREIENNYSKEIDRLREQLNSVRGTESSNSEIMNEKKKLNQQLNKTKREYEKQTRTLNTRIKALETQKARQAEDFERKINQASSTQDKQLKRDYQTLKRSNESAQVDFEKKKEALVSDYERKLAAMKQAHQRELDRLKSSRTAGSTDQIEINKLKEQNKQLQIELEKKTRQIQSIQKSRLGKTTYTSGIKQSAYQQQFQSPQQGQLSQSGVSRYRSPQSEISKEEKEGTQSQISRESQGRSSYQRRYRQQKVIERKYEETEEIISSSSRLSERSETGSGSVNIFKSEMSMREFMDIKKVKDKDNILTLVMIKVIEKAIEQSEKGILNSYTPNNIHFSNFDPSNLQSLIVKFRTPITNRKSKVDGLYLAPQIHQGKQNTLKSVVFTLGVIWDELIHYEIYFKTIDEVQTLTYEFKVRDSKMNPILKNTLFEMMSKDEQKRLQLMEAKRRLSLQRYITSEGKPRR